MATLYKAHTQWEKTHTFSSNNAREVNLVPSWMHWHSLVETGDQTVSDTSGESFEATVSSTTIIGCCSTCCCPPQTRAFLSTRTHTHMEEKHMVRCENRNARKKSLDAIMQNWSNVNFDRAMTSDESFDATVIVSQPSLCCYRPQTRAFLPGHTHVRTQRRAEPISKKTETHKRKTYTLLKSHNMLYC